MKTLKRLRLITALVAATMTLSVANVALAADVTDTVYGVPSCEKGTLLGDKKCVPPDVERNSSVAPIILGIIQSGIMVGDEKGNFNTNKGLTAGELATVLLRISGIKPNNAQSGHWAIPAISQAASMGLMPAEKDPNKLETRMALARSLALFLGIKGDIKASNNFTDVNDLSTDDQLILIALRNAGIFGGYPDGSFQPNSPITRAEMALLIERILSKFKK